MGIARNSFYNLGGSVLPLIVSLVTVPLYLKAIGVERYGILALCWLLVGYFGLFDFGLGTATGQRIASLPHETARERSQLLRSAFALSFLFGLAGGLVLPLAAKALLFGMNRIDVGLTAEVSGSIPWLALAMPFTTSSSVLNGALIGRRRFLAANLSSVAINIACSIAPLVTALTYSHHLPPLIATVVVTKAAGLLVLFAQVRSNLPLERSGFASRHEVMKLVRFGGWVAASNVVTPVLLAVEKLIIPWKLGSAMLSVYMISYNLASRYAMIPQGVRMAMLPDFSVLQEEDLHALEERAQDALCKLTAPISIAGVIALPFLMPLWLGHAVGEPATPVIIILLAGFWWNGCSHIPYAKLQGIGRPDLITKISLIQFVPYLLALVLAINALGIIGAALCWSLRAVVESLIFFWAARNFTSLARIAAPFGMIVTLSAALYFVVPSRSLGYFAAQLLLLAVTSLVAIRLLAGRYAGVYSTIASRLTFNAGGR